MTPVLDVSALGAVVRIELPPLAAFAENARRAWSGAVADGSEPDRTVTLIASDEDRMLERLSTRVTLEALLHQRGKLVMFHAAGIADGSGRVAAFVGPSGRGKTTLGRALGQRFGYVSDETIAVDDSGRVHPYRKPLSVVRPDQPKQQVSPADAGLLDLPDAPLRLQALVVIERDAGLAAPVAEKAALPDIVDGLVSQLSYLQDLPRPLEQLAAIVDAVGGVTRLRYAEAESVVPLVESLLENEPVAQSWLPVPAASDSGPYDTADVRSAIICDDRLILLTEGWVRVLDGIAPRVWLAAHTGGDMDAITADVVSAFGEPDAGDARSMVRCTLDELIAAGLIRDRSASVE